MPRLPVTDLQPVIAFYKDVLGFVVGPLWPEDAPSFALLEKDEVNQVPVVSGGQLEGLIGRDELLGFIQTRSEFGYSN